MTVHCFTPEAWPARVRIATTTRDGGVSRDAFAGLNLGDHVGDDPDAVRANRQRLAGALPGKVIVSWLAQEHGTRVVPASSDGGPGSRCGRLLDAPAGTRLCRADRRLPAGAAVQRLTGAAWPPRTRAGAGWWPVSSRPR
jgi:hypothetical protein